MTHMESLEDGTGSHSTRGSAITGVKKITGVIGVIVVALSFIFFGTRAEPGAGGFTADDVVVGAGAAAGGLRRLAVFDQTARWMDPASFRGRRRRGNIVSACGHRLERCRLKQRPGAIM